MSIQFRLPTWHTEFTPYLPHLTINQWVIGDPFMGQLYTMKRVAEVLGYESMYVVFPKEEDQLVNPQDIPSLPMVGQRFQYLRQTWNGRDFLWQVDQLVPRWQNFTNEHWLALVSQVSAEFAANVYLLSQGNPEDWTDDAAIVFSNDSCTDCADLTGTLIFTSHPDAFTWEGDPFSWGCNANDVFWRIGYDGGTNAALQLIDNVTNLPLVSWNADRASWDGTSPLEFLPTVSWPTDFCTWGVSVFLTPVYP